MQISHVMGVHFALHQIAMDEFCLNSPVKHPMFGSLNELLIVLRHSM